MTKLFAQIISVIIINFYVLSANDKSIYLKTTLTKILKCLHLNTVAIYIFSLSFTKRNAVTVYKYNSLFFCIL